MGSIGYTPKDQRFTEIEGLSRDAGENLDCSVIALSLAADVPYEKAHKTLKQLGRVSRARTPNNLLRAALKEFGCTIAWLDPQPFIDQYPGVHCTLQNVTTHHPDRFPHVWADGCIYLFFVRGHVATVIDGKNLDWTKGRAQRVKRILKVERPL